MGRGRVRSGIWNRPRNRKPQEPGGGGLDLREGPAAAQKAALGLLGVGADLPPPALGAAATYSDCRSISRNALGKI